MCVCPQRYPKSPSQTKIGQLEVAILVDQQILGLQVAMEDPVGMAVSDTLAQLAHELLDHVRTQTQAPQRNAGSLW